MNPRAPNACLPQILYWTVIYDFIYHSPSPSVSSDACMYTFNHLPYSSVLSLLQAAQLG